MLLAQTFPGFVRCVAAFSPAVSPGDNVFTHVDRLRDTPVGRWCGRDDGLYRNVRALERALPKPPAAGGYTAGRHNFGYLRCLRDSSRARGSIDGRTAAVFELAAGDAAVFASDAADRYDIDATARLGTLTVDRR